MNKLSIVKTVVKTVVGVGAGKIVSDVIKAHVVPTSILDQVTVATAGVVLGSMVADVAAEYTDAKVDEVVTLVTQIRAKAEQD